MSPHPFRLILTSYSLALVLAFAAQQLGLVAQGLIFWLGGAVLVPLLGSLPGLRTWFTSEGAGGLPMPAEAAPDLDQEYRKWDEDAQLEARNHEADRGVAAEETRNAPPASRKSA
ncbi:hypothetical protein KHP62_05575 [Rhodobacteraceae bacterium NNCM2]|nr:hypothetical protein [Coraliihabitans acroporae]